MPAEHGPRSFGYHAGLALLLLLAPVAREIPTIIPDSGSPA